MQEQAVETTVYSIAATAPVQPERREDERYLSLLRVGAIVVDGRRELCLIRNISAGGMMIRAYSDLAPGTAFGPGGETGLRLCFARKSSDLVEAVARLQQALATI